MLDGPQNPGARAIEALQSRLIGAAFGVPTQDVTIDFVSRVLEERVYPNIRLDKDSAYGGYSTQSLVVLTGNEIAKMRREAENVPEELRPVGGHR